MRARRLKEEYAPQLLAAMAAHEIAAGTRLTEEWVVERFGCSRGVSREVIRTLELCDAVVVRHGLGAIVQPPHRWNPLIAMVIRARIESPDGPAVAARYFEYARYFVVIVAMTVVTRDEHAGLALVERTLSRLERATGDDAPTSGAGVDAQLVRAWAEGSLDPMRAHVGAALARALEIAAERMPSLGGLPQASLAIQRALHDAAAGDDGPMLLGLLAGLMTNPP